MSSSPPGQREEDTIAHRSASGINFDDPMFLKDYSPMTAYRRSKLANLMYSLELAQRPSHFRHRTGRRGSSPPLDTQRGTARHQVGHPTCRL